MYDDNAYRKVIRNFHSSINTIEIRAAVEEIGFSVRQITNALHKSTNNPTNIVDRLRTVRNH